MYIYIYISTYTYTKPRFVYIALSGMIPKTGCPFYPPQKTKAPLAGPSRHLTHHHAYGIRAPHDDDAPATRPQPTVGWVSLGRGLEMMFQWYSGILIKIPAI